MELNARGPLENVYAKKECIFEVSPHDTHTKQFLYDSLHNYPLTYGHTAYGGSNDNQQFFGRIFYWSHWVDSFTLSTLPHGVYYALHWAMNEGPKYIHSTAKAHGIQRIVLNGQYIMMMLMTLLNGRSFIILRQEMKIMVALLSTTMR